MVNAVLAWKVLYTRASYIRDLSITAVMKLKMLAPWKKSSDQPRQLIKKQRHYFANNGLSSQGCGFFSGHVWMLELDYKES